MSAMRRSHVTLSMAAFLAVLALDLFSYAQIVSIPGPAVDVRIPELTGLGGRQVNIEPDYGILYFTLIGLDGLEHGGGGVDVQRIDFNMKSEKATGADRMELITYFPLAANFYYVKALFILFISEVEPLQAA